MTIGVRRFQHRLRSLHRRLYTLTGEIRDHGGHMCTTARLAVVLQSLHDIERDLEDYHRCAVEVATRRRLRRNHKARQHGLLQRRLAARSAV